MTELIGTSLQCYSPPHSRCKSTGKCPISLCPCGQARRAPDCDHSEKRLECSLHTDQDFLHFSVNLCTLIMSFICCDRMDTPPTSDDVERLRAHLFSPSHRINSQLLQWGHRICSNPCISPDMCLDWPALVVQLQVCLLDVCMFLFCVYSPCRRAGTLLFTHLFLFLSLATANGFSSKTSLATVAGF